MVWLIVVQMHHHRWLGSSAESGGATDFRVAKARSNGLTSLLNGLQVWFAMRPTIKATTVLVLVLSLGLHWAFLQTVAWTGMILSYSQENSLREAISMTREPAIGLLVGERLLVNTHGMLGYAAMSSVTIRQMLELFEHFIRLRIALITARHEVHADEVRLRFTDNGLTLNPEQLQWVWTPYVQSEKYFTGEAPGMGLGLPLVATLIWQAGGQVQLYNRFDGPGIVVELDVPATAAISLSAAPGEFGKPR